MHWDYVCLGEARTVERLILNRSKWDGAFYDRMEAPTLGSSGIPKMDAPVFCTYADLDRLIETCGMTAEQRHTIDLLMYGHSISDIAEINRKSRQAVNVAFQRAVSRITKQNNMDWGVTYRKNTVRLTK